MAHTNVVHMRTTYMWAVPRQKKFTHNHDIQGYLVWKTWENIVVLNVDVSRKEMNLDRFQLDNVR